MNGEACLCTLMGKGEKKEEKWGRERGETEKGRENEREGRREGGDKER